MFANACLQVVQLHNRHLLLPQRYPRFTLLGQALGSVRLGYEALTKAVPEVTAVAPACNKDSVCTPLGLQHCALTSSYALQGQSSMSACACASLLHSCSKLNDISGILCFVMSTRPCVCGIALSGHMDDKQRCHAVCRSLWIQLDGPSHILWPGWQAARWWHTPTTPWSVPTCYSES